MACYLPNLYLQPNLLLGAPAYIPHCLAHISAWMSHRHLKLNISKFKTSLLLSLLLQNSTNHQPSCSSEKSKRNGFLFSCVPHIYQQALPFHFQKSPLQSPLHHPISSHHLFQRVQQQPPIRSPCFLSVLSTQQPRWPIQHFHAIPLMKILQLLPAACRKNPNAYHRLQSPTQYGPSTLNLSCATLFLLQPHLQPSYSKNCLRNKLSPASVALNMLLCLWISNSLSSFKVQFKFHVLREAFLDHLREDKPSPMSFIILYFSTLW